MRKGETCEKDCRSAVLFLDSFLYDIILTASSKSQNTNCTSTM